MADLNDSHLKAVDEGNSLRRDLKKVNERNEEMNFDLKQSKE